MGRAAWCSSPWISWHQREMLARFAWLQAVRDLMKNGMLQGGPDYVSLIAHGDDWCESCWPRPAAQLHCIACSGFALLWVLTHPHRFSEMLLGSLSLTRACRRAVHCREDPTMVRFPSDEAARHAAVVLLVSYSA